MYKRSKNSKNLQNQYSNTKKLKKYQEELKNSKLKKRKNLAPSKILLNDSYIIITFIFAILNSL